VACKQFSGIFTFPGSGVVKRYVITTSVSQVSTASIKFEAAKRLGNITGKSNIEIPYHSEKKQICVSECHPQLSSSLYATVYKT